MTIQSDFDRGYEAAQALGRVRVKEAVDECQRRYAKMESDLARCRQLMKDGRAYVVKRGWPQRMWNGEPTFSAYDSGGLASLIDTALALQAELHHHFGCDEKCQERFPEAHKDNSAQGEKP